MAPALGAFAPLPVSHPSDPLLLMCLLLTLVSPLLLEGNCNPPLAPSWDGKGCAQAARWVTWPRLPTLPFRQTHPDCTPWFLVPC